jgi:protein-S-isoprenylcysteine O-methyltransferase Ste14
MTVEIQTVRRLVLGLAVLICVLMYVFTNSRLDAANSIHEMIEWVGIVAIVICILGRTWASLYVAACKAEPFVTQGPYSVMRNPLYFFSILGIAGVGLQLGSVVAGVVFGVLAWAVGYVTALQEERAMMERHGVAFADYMATVPRFLPNPRLWRDLSTLTIVPPTILRTFGDATVLLLSVLVAEGFEQLQNMGILPVLLRLP